MKYTLTNDSVTVVDGGGVAHSVRRGAPNFEPLRAAVLAGDWGAASAALTPAGGVAAWSSGAFSLGPSGAVLHAGRPVPETFGKRVLDTLAEGGAVDPLLRFFERLARNPSWRSATMLFDFMQHAGIPVAPDGSVLAYKGVTGDYKDVHSSTCSAPGCDHRTYDNRPGSRNEMPRAAVSDDPDVPCHAGFHVGSLEYARGFGKRVVVCAVDPADVVCVPKDCSHQKLRCCRYRVVGHLGDRLPSTLFEGPTEPPPSAQQGPQRAYTAEELVGLPIADLRRVAAGIGIVASTSRGAPVSRSALVVEILRVTEG